MPYYLVELDGKLLEIVLKEHETLKVMFKHVIKKHFGEKVLAIMDSKVAKLFERAREILVTEGERFKLIVFNPEKKIIKARIENKGIIEGKVKAAKYVLTTDLNGKVKLVLEGKVPYDEVSYFVVVDEEKGVCECKAYEIGLEKALVRERILGISDANLTYPCKHVLAVTTIYTAIRKLLGDKEFRIDRTPMFERLIRRFVLSNM
ncbi:MAG: hypothetical protein B6U76_10520 [Desulfurococcales archaeon ex4484_217_2]|nr:MAG: hypothetical protein B6U76_10520 [Desulfurococcales archaeon ex4484_217_2]